MNEFNIGFIGLGTMGESMCENILKKSSQTVYIYDINLSQVDKMVNLGGTACKDIPDIAAKANLIFIMVPKNEHVIDVITQLLPHLKKGTIICDMSTISPNISRELAEKVKNVGSIMIDAPVVKSKSAAISGTLGILVGGDESTLERIKPILLYMGAEVIHYGLNGNGLVMKLCHNMLVGMIQNGNNEMILMAQAAGLDYDKVLQGVRAGGGQNFYLDGKGPTIKQGDFSPKFSVQNMHKDMHLASDLADELNLDLVAVNHVRDIYDDAINEFAAEDFSATYKTVKKRSTKH